MQIVLNTENKELIYELVYDEEKLKKLISEIIENCSIRIKGKYCVTARTSAEAQRKIDCSLSWNCSKIHENVSDLCEEPSKDSFDFWRIGDPKTYSFTSERLTNPRLVNFLIDILHNDQKINYEWFVKRKELSQKQELQLAIQKLDSDINQISNFDTERKIKMLQDLAKKLISFNNIPDFNYELLAKYYDMAEECLKLELLQETIKYQKKLTIK